MELTLYGKKRHLRVNRFDALWKPAGQVIQVIIVFAVLRQFKYSAAFVCPKFITIDVADDNRLHNIVSLLITPINIFLEAAIVWIKMSEQPPGCLAFPHPWRAIIPYKGV